MRTGLVLGKFAPLHKGHQLLIDTAVEENEKVIVMIYDAPDVTSVSLFGPSTQVTYACPRQTTGLDWP